jgi:hypothetical protein
MLGPNCKKKYKKGIGGLAPPRYSVEMSGQFQNPIALIPGRTHMQLKEEPGWAPETVWNL